MATHVLALTVDLRIADAHSLKEKRSVVTTILEGARRRFQVAVAETGRLDAHQRAELAFVGVSGLGHPHRRDDRLGRAVRVVVPRDRGRRRRTVTGWRSTRGDRMVSQAAQAPPVPAHGPAEPAAPARSWPTSSSRSTTSASSCSPSSSVDVDADLHRAIVYFDSLQGPEGDEVVSRRWTSIRKRLRQAVGRQARIKRVPELVFRPDPAVREGGRIEEILAEIGPHPRRRPRPRPATRRRPDAPDAPTDERRELTDGGR